MYLLTILIFCVNLTQSIRMTNEIGRKIKKKNVDAAQIYMLPNVCSINNRRIFVLTSNVKLIKPITVDFIGPMYMYA